MKKKNTNSIFIYTSKLFLIILYSCFLPHEDYTSANIYSNKKDKFSL